MSTSNTCQYNHKYYSSTLKKTISFECLKDSLSSGYCIFHDEDYLPEHEKEIEGMISSILSTPMAKIYPKILTTEPGPWRVNEENIDYSETKFTLNHGFSFVIKDEEGNKYHEMCYQHLQNLKPIIQPKSEQEKRGSK